jgi:DNA-binding CsgD family transcriptional regulator/tetratricopeptide (TPR) repeat protein
MNPVEYWTGWRSLDRLLESMPASEIAVVNSLQQASMFVQTTDGFRTRRQSVEMRATPDRDGLLERALQLAQANECLDGVRRNKNGCCLLLHGEAGIGKTSLVQTFLASLDPARTRSLVTGCEALFTARPLGPLVDLASQFPPALAHALHEGQLWNGLFPALLAWLQDSKWPTVLVIEDMHWADAGTLDFVRFAGRRVRETSLLLVLTYRDDGLDADHVLSGVLGELPAPSTVRVPIPRLSPRAVGALADRTGNPRRGLYAATGGNPFYVTEVLSTRAPGVPPSVSAAVLARLAQLSPAGRAVAEQVSVFPNQVQRTLLERLDPTALGAIDECLRQGLLVARGESVAFRHELAREAVLGAVLPHRRALLHAAAFHALRNGDDVDDSLSRQVHHAESAGLTDEVARLAQDAARYAAASGVQREAARLYALALRHGTVLSAAERADLLETRAVCCMLISRHDEAIQARREALQLRRKLGDRRGEGANLRWLARLLALVEGIRPAFECARQAVEVLEHLPPGRELALACSSLSHLHMLENDFVSAQRLGERAIALAEALHDAEALSHALNTVAVVRLRRCNDPEAWAMLERSLALARQHGCDADAARAFNNLYIMSLTQRDFERAAGHAERGIAFCEERGIDIFNVRIRIRRAFACMQTGHWDLAERDLTLVAETHAPSPMEEATRDFVQHLLDVRRGGVHAYERLESAIATMHRLGVPIWFTSTAAARAEADWLRGDDDAVAVVRPRLVEAIKAGDAWSAGELAAWLHRLGRPWTGPIPAVALPYELELSGRLREAATEWTRLGCPYERALVLAGGDDADVRDALATFERLGAYPAAELARRRLRQLGASAVQRGPQPRTRKDPLGLTARERQIFDLLLHGLSNVNIAARLHRSVRTIEHHVAAVLAKAQVCSRAELIAHFCAPPSTKLN